MDVPSLCCIIPAFKDDTSIPDQYVKKLAGIPLIQHALNTAKTLARLGGVHVVTDIEEVGLISRRNGVFCELVDEKADNDEKRKSIIELVRSMCAKYDPCVILRATSPLISALDIREACENLIFSDSDCLMSTRLSAPRLKNHENRLESLLFPENEPPLPVSTGGLCVLRCSLFKKAGTPLKVMNWPLMQERSVEISSYLDWWLCEKLLKSKHVVFVVAGYPAIGMGHIYRTLMLAHEIDDHRITFLCTRESGLAAARIAGKDYQAVIQGEESLAEATLRLAPDLVINDILDTDESYILALKQSGIPVVNFEDSGPGAAHANLVVNALYPSGGKGLCKAKHILCGHKYFCLRDEFLNARQNEFNERPRRLLITFGGTDPADYTRQALAAVLPLCREHGVSISIVTGPGYPRIAQLEEDITLAARTPSSPPITFTHSTNIMSQVMEGCDMAISSAGRTVYELAHMRIPSIVLSQNERESLHTFARPGRGFTYLGVLAPEEMRKLSAAFATLLDPKVRRVMFNRMAGLDFAPNKSRVMKRILSLLDNGENR